MFKQIAEPVQVAVAEYFVTTGVQRYLIGRIYTVTAPEGATSFVAESHDWDSGGQEYQPRHIGAYKDPSDAEDEIERLAREATQ